MYEIDKKLLGAFIAELRKEKGEVSNLSFSCSTIH